MANMADFSATDIHGQDRSLGDYLGKVVLVVNVASRCGFTGQYAGLQQLFSELTDRGLVILGFPCNQFGSQEPGDEAAIESFCETHYGVTFPMFAKIEVNGSGAHPFYEWLKSSMPGVLGTEAIKWNFTKFLLDRQGNVVKRYAPNATPESIRPDIEALL
ncbi:MAG: glutathione peroxidase [Burkholderiaceae bacterium]|nr:glutathione peroxidase [Burkholderiaceae bacterium]MCD8516306.1 glutathione peroxidase [Burkholderiaceae bacterium]MCD8537143.1 glutathione peroxidase [Burkholderiaceae bacterium]MCD8566290.1 glutathione peroxidase [Burkholderiaceae bacterium]